MFMTYLFLRSTRARYDPTSFTLPLEVATVMDIRLHEEEQQEAAAAAAALNTSGEVPKPQAHARNEPVDNPDTTDPARSLPDWGTRIGPYDPFENAYVQPALRANPRARPEQPFPPAQLGRDDLTHAYAQTVAAATGGAPLGGTTGVDSQRIQQHQPAFPVFDNGARVRLKGLHQRDRRNLNHWWNDQLQKCGDQNIFKILMGEECGTLTIPDYRFGGAQSIMNRQGLGALKGNHEVV